MQCPCNNTKIYAECCEPYHQGQAVPTAEALMRSRYSAYALKDAKYLYKSWSKQTRPSKKALKQDQGTQWLGLEIIHTEDGGAFDAQGIVEFKATFSNADGKNQLHETRRFERENGRWVYLDGEY